MRFGDKPYSCGLVTCAFATHKSGRPALLVLFARDSLLPVKRYFLSRAIGHEFFRHGEIYRSEVARQASRERSPLPVPIGFDEFPASAILTHRREGTRGYFKAESRSPVFRELQQLFEKTTGMIPIVEQILEPFGDKIRCAFVYGSVARNREHATSDVDLMVVGNAGLADLSPALRKAEQRLGREVNATVYSPGEFREKVLSHDHFLTTVLKGRKHFVRGGQNDLDEIVGK